MALHNSIVAPLAVDPPGLPPGVAFRTPAVANFNDDASLSAWARGFADGYTWIEDSWEGIDEDDEEFGGVLAVLSFFSSTRFAAGAFERRPDDDLTELSETIQELFADAAVEYQQAGRLLNEPPAPFVRPAPKTGRRRLPVRQRPQVQEVLRRGHRTVISRPTTPVMSARVLLFDLAGVLIDFRGVESLHTLSDGRVDADAFGRFWSHSPWADALYCGRCSPDAFAAGAVDEFGLRVSPAEFLTEFRGWLRGPYTGAIELLRALRRSYQLACLSNTNELDVVRFRSELRLHDLFDRCFFSNEIGLRKPDAACYRHVVDALGVRAEDVLFFDDSRECIEGARAAGLQAHQTIGLDALRATLGRVGVLSE